MVKRKLRDDPDFEEGENELDIYDDKGREELVDEDEISDLEEGFVEGYEHGEHEAKCAECGVVLIDKEVVEEDIDNEHYLFCSSECASSFETGKPRKKSRINKKI